MDKTVISILTGLGGMFGWGTSDFFGNNVTHKIGNFRSIFWSQIFSTSIICIALIIFHPSLDISAAMLPLVLVTGIGYSLGYLYYYKAFEVGNLSLTSVVINLNAVITMFTVYILFGERLKGLQIPGVIFIFSGIILASVNFRELAKKKRQFLFAGVKEAIIASFMFGALHWATTDYLVARANWLWVALGTKFFALAIVFGIATFRKIPLRIADSRKNIWRLIILVGVLEGLAVLSVNFGFSVGKSILVAPIANSVAVVTVGLALVFLREKITKIQAVGMILAVVGIILTGF